MKSQLPTLAITVGEPAGIGPEISLRAAWQERFQCRSVLIGDGDFLRQLALQIDTEIQLSVVSDLTQIPAESACTSSPTLLVLNCPLAQSVEAGQLDPRNGLAVLVCSARYSV